MLRPIVKYGGDVLHEPARNVDIITDEVTTLIDDMIATMYAAPGIGLAAPQVGVPLRIFVIDLSVGRDPSGLLVMLNPVFVEQEGMQLEEEGCLSMPGFTATVARPSRVVVRGLDRDGREQVREGTGLLARAF
jgi:peptide deformylase